MNYFACSLAFSMLFVQNVVSFLPIIVHGFQCHICKVHPRAELLYIIYFYILQYVYFALMVDLWLAFFAPW